MNGYLDAYLSAVNNANSLALKTGKIAISESIPCTIFRELQVPENRFVDSSDPFLMSYQALRKIQRVSRPIIPRKIEFGSSVYLKEGVIDCIYPNSPVTLLFIGDGNSDKRFAYNSRRLFAGLGNSFSSHCFICNSDLIGTVFGNQAVSPGWDDDGFFYHAASWAELPVINDLVAERYANARIIAIVDVDGTLLCPRPNYSNKIKDARKVAIDRLCGMTFDDAFFAIDSPDHRDKLENSYVKALRTGFSRAHDDEDLSMLIALGLYAELITEDDILLNPSAGIGFVSPIEWLQYAIFRIENDASSDYPLRQLRTLYMKCAEALQAGSPTAFVEFRKQEERVLTEGAHLDEIVVNRALIEFICRSVGQRVVPIGFSDRPNASFGLVTATTSPFTATAPEESLFHTPLTLA